jgi:hypothetical protein
MPPSPGHSFKSDRHPIPIIVIRIAPIGCPRGRLLGEAPVPGLACSGALVESDTFLLALHGLPTLPSLAWIALSRTNALLPKLDLTGGAAFKSAPRRAAPHQGDVPLAAAVAVTTASLRARCLSRGFGWTPLKQPIVPEARTQRYKDIDQGVSAVPVPGLNLTQEAGLRSVPAQL